MLIPSIINNQQYYEFDEEHLLEILPLVEEAVRRLESPDAANVFASEDALLPRAWYNSIAASATTLQIAFEQGH